MATNSFSQFASRLLSNPANQSPLFYSVREEPTEDDDDSTESIQLGTSNHQLDSTRSRLHHQPEQDTTNTRSGFTPALSKLWNATTTPQKPAWRLHQSTTEDSSPPTLAAYGEDDEEEGEYEGEDEEEDDSDTSPPRGAFLSKPHHHQSPESQRGQIRNGNSWFIPRRGAPERGGARPGLGLGLELVEPLLPATTLYRPHSTTPPSPFNDSQWIALYGFSILSVIWFGIREAYRSNSSSLPSLYPVLPSLSLLSLISLLTALSSLFFLFHVRNSVRHLVQGALVCAPLGMLACGCFALAASVGGETEGKSRWMLRAFAVACFGAVVVVARIAWIKRRRVERTIKVLELAASIILSSPSLVLLCLSLSAFSTVATLPFLYILSSILSTPPILATRWTYCEAVGTMGVLVWSLAILRGMQKVSVAGVVGEYWFCREMEDREGGVEVTRNSFARAKGPSLGTIIAVSFITTLFTLLSLLFRQIQRLLRSTNFPTFLQPLTILVPILGFVAASVEVYTGFILVYVGLSGEGLRESKGKVASLLLAGRNSTLGDNFLVKFTLLLTSVTFGLLSGLITYLVASSHHDLKDPSLAPVLAILCFLIPFWTVRLTGEMVGDAADAGWVCLAWEEESGLAEGRCKEGKEAFMEPDAESLV